VSGIFITFEGTEGGGKSTQIKLLAERLRALGCTVRVLREPGGTPIGEEIRHTLKHSESNHAMTPEAELLLMNASRAQLVREVIRPALAAGEVVLCDRFYDSTTAYQGYGRQLSLEMVGTVVEFAVGTTRPDITLLLKVPVTVSEARRQSRSSTAFSSAEADVPGQPPIRDRMEDADRGFFERVELGFDAIARAEAARVKVVDATAEVGEVAAEIWERVEPLLRENHLLCAK
jgi:dTMP kinase